VDQKKKEVDSSCFKLCYTVKVRSRNR